MFLDYFKEVFRERQDRDFMVWNDEVYSYRWLCDAMDEKSRMLDQLGIPPQSVVSITADFSPDAVALFLCFVDRGNIVVPLTSSLPPDSLLRCREIAQAGFDFVIDSEGVIASRPTEALARHPLLLKLFEKKHPGLVLFSSGSTGEPKAILHDMVDLLRKFTVPKQSKRILSFLLFDHIGGINTMLYALSNAACIVTVKDRLPDAVLGAVERFKVEILPVSPSFLNMILLSEAYQRHDLSSLELITYGTEVMPENTLAALHNALPDVKLQQTYGLSEVGILRSKSRDSSTTWVKIGGEGFETRVVDGKLQIKAESAMLGYLNAESPFTNDGWFITGDEVEVDGAYFKIRGRESEIINVGGQKVYPAAVEGLLMEMDGVEDVLVMAEKNPIMGNVVAAKFNLSAEEDERSFIKRMRAFCKDRLEPYQIPVKVYFQQDRLVSDRFKKIRK